MFIKERYIVIYEEQCITVEAKEENHDVDDVRYIEGNDGLYV